MALAVRPVSAEARELANQHDVIRATVDFIKEHEVYLVLRDGCGRYIDGMWTNENGPHWSVIMG